MTARAILRRLLSTVAGLAPAVAGVAGLPGAAPAATSLPCDIYGAAGTPCVGAHSTVRALYAAYNGPLYQIQRVSDAATTDVGLLSAGGTPTRPPRTVSAPARPASSRSSTTSRRGTTT